MSAVLFFMGLALMAVGGGLLVESIHRPPADVVGMIAFIVLPICAIFVGCNAVIVAITHGR